MQGTESKEWKINYITAISTAILAFTSIVALTFALVEFIEKKILGITGSFIILVFIFLGLIIIISLIKRWIKK